MKDDLEARVSAATNRQKGEALALTSLLMAVLRSMPAEQLAAALREFDTECEAARAALLHAPSDELIQGFEVAAKAVNALRYVPPEGDGRTLV